VCGHVLYNVPDLEPFVAALDQAATRRVVVEITAAHPLTATGWLWKRFWDLDRPDGPTWEDAVAVLREAGVAPSVEHWEAPGLDATRPGAHSHDFVAFTRRRLCLPPEREPEVREALIERGPGGPRRLVTLWWDIA
jgi:hypothetical protein